MSLKSPLWNEGTSQYVFNTGFVRGLMKSYIFMTGLFF